MVVAEAHTSATAWAMWLHDSGHHSHPTSTTTSATSQRHTPAYTRPVSKKNARHPQHRRQPPPLHVLAGLLLA